METLNDTKNKNKIFLMTAVFLLAAAVISFGSIAFADNGAEVASFRTMNTAIVKGSEKVPSISVGEFIKNIGKNTGIYKMIHTETPEEIEAAEAEKAAIASQEAEDPFSGVIVSGWQKLLMLAIGFLIVYLGAAKGFEPLLLIPIGFGTILVNIPGAGMGDAPHGMLQCRRRKRILPYADFYGNWCDDGFWSAYCKSKDGAPWRCCTTWYFCYSVRRCADESYSGR